MPDPVEPNPNPSPTPNPAPTPEPNPNPTPAPVIDPAKPAEPAKPVEPVAITAADIKLPEGAEINEEIQTEFLGLMNDQKLTPQERVQKLVDLQGKAMQAASERASQMWADKQTEWQNEVKADKEIGGAALDGVLGGISTLLNTHGTPELRQAFDETGAGNNIHIVRFLHKIAGFVGEGKAMPANIPPTPPASLADRLFPNHK